MVPELLCLNCMKKLESSRWLSCLSLIFCLSFLSQVEAKPLQLLPVATVTNPAKVRRQKEIKKPIKKITNKKEKREHLIKFVFVQKPTKKILRERASDRKPASVFDPHFEVALKPHSEK